MVRVQLVIPDADRDRFVRQTRQKEMSLGAWLLVAAHTRLKERQRLKPFESPEDVKEFFERCDAPEGPETEPDWKEHLRAINDSRAAGASGT